MSSYAKTITLQSTLSINKEAYLLKLKPQNGAGSRYKKTPKCIHGSEFNQIQDFYPFFSEPEAHGTICNEAISYYEKCMYRKT